MRNFCLTLAYDGGRYQGWQKQGNTPNTIQQKLEDTLSRLLGERIELHGCGRTDAGVHARCQTASFRAATPESCAVLLERLRRVLPEDIGAIALQETGERFHARLSCREKTYLYRLWNSAEPCVFERKYVWRVPERLDEAAMARAAALLTGRHDFAAFRTGRGKKSSVRTLREIRLERAGAELRLFYTGDGFLYNMVRILTGTLVEVGRGERRAESVAALLAASDRSSAGVTAPAQGLTLWDVRYDGDLFLTKDGEHDIL